MSDNKNHWVLKLKRIIQFPIFESRWMLIVFYYGLVVGLGIYAIKFVEEIINLIRNFQHVQTEEVLITLLTLTDMVMIGNLIKMISTGSYQNFIEKFNDKVEKVSGGGLKVKIATSLAILAGINLLPWFISTKVLNEKIELIGVFMALALVLATIEWIHAKSRVLEYELEKSESQEESQHEQTH